MHALQRVWGWPHLGASQTSAIVKDGTGKYSHESTLPTVHIPNHSDAHLLGARAAQCKAWGCKQEGSQPAFQPLGAVWTTASSSAEHLPGSDYPRHSAE